MSAAFVLAAALAAAGGPPPATDQAQAPAPVRPPAVVHRVDAVYPPQALASGRQADVTLELTVGADGKVSDVRVTSSGGADFDASAIAAISQWQFTPALEGDKPVAVRIRVPFAFRPPTVVPAPALPTQPPPPLGPSAGAATGSPAPSTQEAAPAPPSSPAETGATSAPPAGQASPAPETPPPLVTESGGKQEELDATIHGRAQQRSRGTADYQVNVGQLSVVPRKAADELLKLAPGILLTNEGGEGHASQIFLRGFDAREGQDIEISVGGVPVNEAGNLHGNGYADLHFVIPEVVSSLRVLEGPFEPHQGNFAVAGSAEYELGLDQRGVGLSVGSGSYGTRRVLALWGPPGASKGTFGAAEIYQTNGFGQTRDAVRGSGLAPYEGRVGESLYRVTLQAYSSRWHQAGLLREDDFQAGRVEFFGTYDPRQGGDATRFSISGELEGHAGGVTWRNQAFLILGTSRLRENFTGFLLDPQEPIQPLHDQRGDLIDRSSTATTIGARGFARAAFTALGHRQEAEVGYFARYDITDGTQYRIEAATGHPYHLDLDLLSHTADVGLYGDLSLMLLRWLTVRGGARLDLLTYDILNRCAAQSVAHPSKTNPPGDQSCLSQEDFGAHREPVQSVTTASTALEPRVTAIATILPGLSASASWGEGFRSIDPQYVTENVKTPFATAKSVEAGVAYSRDLGGVSTALRTAVFQTRVDKDLVFSESAGRNVLGGASTRLGWLAALRATGGWFDEALNVTLVHATFDDTKTLIPYVPDVVLRSDTSLWRALPWHPGGVPIVASIGAGVTYVGPRPIPFGQRSDPIFTIDASASLQREPFRLILSATNLLDTRYRLGEFNYTSDFHSQPSPTLVPVRHFTAGAPRIVMLTLEVLFGGGRP